MLIEFKIREMGPRYLFDPWVEIVIKEIASKILGGAVKQFLGWLKERRKKIRGFGHVVYKTIEVARSEAMYDLETINKVKNYELLEMRSINNSFYFLFLDKETGIKHEYIITRTCKVKSYSRKR